MDGIPANFDFQLLPDDWDQFEILMENALVRVPPWSTAEVKTFFNGPESFTPDNNFLLGEAPELRNFFVGAGFNSMGIASAGGAGRALAEWIVDGEPTMDLWPVDIRRFAAFNNNPPGCTTASRKRSACTTPCRGRTASSTPRARSAARRSTIASPPRAPCSAPRWAGSGQLVRRRRRRAANDYAFGRQNWHEALQREMTATREAVAIFDQTSFAKLLVQGRDAWAVLQRICADDVDVPVGTSVYTGVLNARGGYRERPHRRARSAADNFLIVTGSAQPTRDADWIGASIPADAHAVADRRHLGLCSARR